MKRFALIALALLAVVALSRPASAAPIGSVTFDDCPACSDMDFSLSLDLTGALYTLTYTIGESNQNDFNLNRVSAIDFKINTGTLTGLVVVSAPSGTAWIVEPGEKSAGNGDGCQNSGNGFNCVSAVGPANFVPVSASSLTWVLTFTGVSGGSLIGDPSEWHIGAKFNDLDGGVTGNVISLVPEPTTMALVGLGFAAFVLRRRS